MMTRRIAALAVMLLFGAAMSGCSKPAESLPEQSGNEPVSSVVQTSSQSDAEFFTFTEGSRTGVQNRAGKILVEAKYNEIEIVPQGAFLAKISDHNFDLYNQQGELVRSGFSSLSLVEQSGGSVIAGEILAEPDEAYLKSPMALLLEGRTEVYFTYLFNPDASPFGPAEKWNDVGLDYTQISAVADGDFYLLNIDGTVKEVHKKGVDLKFLNGKYFTEIYYVWTNKVANCLKEKSGKVIVPYGLWSGCEMIGTDRFIIHSGEGGSYDSIHCKLYDANGTLITDEYNWMGFAEGNTVGFGFVAIGIESPTADFYLLDKNGKKLSPVYIKILYDEATQTFTATGKDGSTTVYDKDGNKK